MLWEHVCTNTHTLFIARIHFLKTGPFCNEKLFVCTNYMSCTLHKYSARIIIFSAIINKFNARIMCVRLLVIA